MKEFNDWNQQKKKLEKAEKQKFCKNRQLWWCKVGENLGNEISRQKPFMRPVLVLNANFGGDLILVAPITNKKNKDLEQYFYEIKDIEEYGVSGFIILNQTRAISKKRMMQRITGEENFKPLKKDIFIEILQKYKELI